MTTKTIEKLKPLVLLIKTADIAAATKVLLGVYSQGFWTGLILGFVIMSLVILIGKYT